MALKLITAPAAEPLSLARVKEHLRIDSNDDDLLLSNLIIVARQEAEKITRRALVTQTWELVLDTFPAVICVPLPCLQSVTSIKYIDQDGTERTLDPSAYQVDIDTEPARIVPAYGLTWPGCRNQVNAVRVRYVAGYGAADAVPAAIKQWMMVRIGTLYENRESVNVGGTVTEISFADGLLDEYRVVTF